MILTNQMIEMAKEIAWQQADHYIHLESDGAQIEDYVFFIYKQRNSIESLGE